MQISLKLLLLSCFTLSFSAQASFYQEHCSNGEGTMRIASGHVDNFVEVTQRKWVNGNLVDKKVRLSILPDFLSQDTLSESTSSSCSTDSPYGYVSWNEVSYRQVVLRNEDGSLFAKDIVGVSHDRTRVEAHLICELNGNSETLCNGEE